MIWGHVHCALPRYDYSFCDQWKIRNCAFQEQFLTKSAKFAIVNTHEKRFERCPYLQFFCCFFSVKLGGCRWQRLFMEETKSGKNTLCATAESWDSIRLNCSPTPPPCNKKLVSWKIPHAPPQKNKMSTQQQRKGLNLDGNLKLGLEVTPDPSLQRQKEI